jgi:hypothetical protein
MALFPIDVLALYNDPVTLHPFGIFGLKSIREIEMYFIVLARFVKVLGP